MSRLRTWLHALVVAAVLEALKARDEAIDAELDHLHGVGGEQARARYEQLQHGRLY